MMFARVMFEPTRGVIARRIGRIAFGGALVVGALRLVEAAVTQHLGHGDGAINAYEVIYQSWLSAIALWAVARVVAARVPWHRNPDFLLAHSVCMPMVGLALLLPLSLHLVWFTPWAAGDDLNRFNDWVQVSMVITGAAHLTLMLGVIWRGRALVAGTPAPTPGEIYAYTIVVSCVPFILLLAIPPLLVAVTGLPFLPLMHRMAKIVERERAELAHAPHVPPRAVVI
jgi:hypothetical protein